MTGAFDWEERDRGPEWARRVAEEQKRHLTSVEYRATRIGEMAKALWKAREGTLEPDWRDRLNPRPHGDLAHEMYRDADELAVADVREMPPAAWEPYVGAGDWRKALDEWYIASLGNLKASLNLHAERQQLSRNIRFDMLIHFHRTLRTTYVGQETQIGQQTQALIDQHHERQPGVDRTAAQELAIEVRDRDFLDAWYRAGLAAGGEPVDWIGWYQRRIDGWANAELAARAQGQLDDAAVRAEFESLPRYWLVLSSADS